MSACGIVVAADVCKGLKAMILGRGYWLLALMAACWSAASIMICSSGSHILVARYGYWRVIRILSLRSVSILGGACWRARAKTPPSASGTWKAASVWASYGERLM